MNQFIVSVSNMVFSGCIALYVLFSMIGAFRQQSPKVQKGISGAQVILMSGFHLIAYLDLFYLSKNVDYLFFYGFQVIAFFSCLILSKAVYPEINRLLVNHMCFLLMIGMTILSRLSFEKSVKQFIIVVIAMVFALLLPLIVKKFRFLSSMSVFYAVFGIGLLSVVYLYGAVTYGSKISYTVAGITFQPSELVKIVYIFFIAAVLQKSVKLGRVFMTALVACTHVVILVLSKDLGSAIIFFVVFVCMLFVSTKNPWYLILGLASSVAASVVAYKLFTHVQTRFIAWQDPWTTIDKEGYQIAQSLFAIGSGKWFGLGLFQGSPSSIPFVSADFIFSAIAQELGVVFAVCLILLYLSLFILIVRLSMNIRNRFYRMIGIGIAVCIGFQTFLTIGGGCKLIPSTGVTLPLISYGGTSVFVTVLMFGILFGISIVARMEEESGNVYIAGYENGYSEDYDEGFDAELDSKYDEIVFDKRGNQYGFSYDEYGYAYDNYGNIYDAKGRPCDRNGNFYDPAAYPEKYGNPMTQALMAAKAGMGNSKKVIHTQKNNGNNGKSGKNEKNEKQERSGYEITVLIAAFGVLFVIMSGYICNYVYQNDNTLIANDYNPVQRILESQNVRGTIYSRDGEELAYSSVDSDGEETRVYPYEDLFCHAVGYATKGKSGIEKLTNVYLIQSSVSLFTKMEAEENNAKNPGDDVYTTLDVSLQEVAKKALGVYSGAVIVTDVKTGEILSMYSNPGFDPNEIDDEWDSLVEDEDSSVLLNRVTQGLYPPGSTFKILTALEYIKENSTSYENYSFNCNGTYKTDSGVIHCYHSNSHGEVDFVKSFAKSCNSSFANIGLSLNKKSFAKTLNEMYFNKDLPFDLPYSKSQVTMNSDINEYDCMQVSIGQGTTLITPLHLNMITSAIANDGVLVEPHLLKNVVDADGNEVKNFEQAQSYTLISDTDVIDEMKKLMTAVVEEGTAKKLNGLSYTAAGKTGSAEYNSNKSDSHAWFTGFAPTEDPQISVTVIVEGAGSGGDFAVPIAKKIFNAYFSVED